MSGPSLRDSQLELARYLRNPASSPPPQGVEQRRLDIYQGLIYNNIEGFISSGFPVLRSLYEDEAWHELVQDFIDGHRCHTPYFLEISQEFIQFLLEEYQARETDPPFMAELAHYEWVELALDVSEDTPPESVPWEDALAVVPRLSPLAWLLSYRFPVHRIGPGHRPTEAGDTTFLVVYRNQEERVCFMELNAVSARLVEMTRDNEDASGRVLLHTLAGEMAMEADAMLEFGTQQLASLLECGVLVAASAPQSDNS